MLVKDIGPIPVKNGDPESVRLAWNLSRLMFNIPSLYCVYRTGSLVHLVGDYKHHLIVTERTVICMHELGNWTIMLIKRDDDFIVKQFGCNVATSMFLDIICAFIERWEAFFLTSAIVDENMKLQVPQVENEQVKRILGGEVRQHNGVYYRAFDLFFSP